MSSSSPQKADKPRRSGSPLVALFILLLTFVGAFLTYPGALDRLRNRSGDGLGTALAKVPPTYTPLSVSILPSSAGATDGGLRVRLTFLDLSGGEIATLERGFRGQSLVLECANLEAPPRKSLPGRSLLLPRLIRDGGPEALATPLLGTYNHDGFPAVLDGPGQSPAYTPAERKALATAYSALSKGSAQRGRVLVLLSGLAPGQSYRLDVGPTGEAELARTDKEAGDNR